MKQKKIPMRMCIVTRDRFEKKELLRIVKNKEGFVSYDPTGKVSGKGCYLKNDIEIIKKAQDKKILDRVLETTIPKELYEEILNLKK